MSFLKRLFGRPKGAGQRDAGELEEPAESEDSGWAIQQTAPLHATSAATRPLPPLDSYLKIPGLRYAQATDVGMKRENNEDVLYTLSGVIDTVERQPPFGVFIVADGLGGREGGELVSATAIRVVARQIAKAVYLPLLDDVGAKKERKPIPEVLEEALEEANQVVLRHPSGGATTMTVAVIHGSSLYLCHAGDSRAYLINEGSIERITRDHTLVERLVEIGQLSPEEARVHPDRNKVYKALGREEVLEPQRLTRRLQAENKVLLCSDGLWGEVEDTTLLKIVQDTPDLQEACGRLVDEANAAGGKDNITAVLIQVPGGAQELG